MKQTIFENYAEVRRQIADLEQEQEKLEVKVLKEMEKEGFETINQPYGTFSRTIRNVWTYSEKIKTLSENQKMLLSAAKKTEEESGTATAEEKVGLSYRVIKEK